MTATITTVSDAVVWGEALRHREGTLWSSDTQASRLITVTRSGVVHRRLTEPINGSWFLPDGRLAVARWHAKRIDVLTDDGIVIYADLGGFVRDAIGDMTGTPGGWLYVDDVGFDPFSGAATGRILAVDPGRSTRIAAEGLCFPNGLAVVDDTLIVAETTATRLTAFDIATDGLLVNRRTWADLGSLLSERHRPDGIWPAPDGSVWVAATAGEEFVRVRGSQVLDRVSTPGEFAISCCLDGGALFLSASHSIEPGLDLLTEALPQRKVRGRIARVDVTT